MATNQTKMNHQAGSRVPQPGKRPMLVSNLDEARKDSVLSEEVFQATLTHERRRAERSRKPFVLMLLDAHQENGLAAKLLNQTRGVVAASIRETDLLGWYKKDSILGVIFTELGVDEGGSITEILQDKVAKALQEKLGPVMAAKIVVSLHLFPENWDRNLPGWVADSKLYPDIEKQEPQKKASLGVKRLIDIAGSAALLFLLLPVLAAIAIIIKLTSKGPVLFEQERLGQFGASSFAACTPTAIPRSTRSMCSSSSQAAPNLIVKARRALRSTRSPTIRGSHPLAGSYARPASMSFLSSGMFCAARCPW
jgi:hypothetical protein